MWRYAGHTEDGEWLVYDKSGDIIRASQATADDRVKVVWTAGDTRQIPGLRRSGLRSGNLWPIWSCVSLAAGYAGIAIFHRT